MLRACCLAGADPSTAAPEAARHGGPTQQLTSPCPRIRAGSRVLHPAAPAPHTSRNHIRGQHSRQGCKTQTQCRCHPRVSDTSTPTSNDMLDTGQGKVRTRRLKNTAKPCPTSRDSAIATVRPAACLPHACMAPQAATSISCMPGAARRPSLGCCCRQSAPAPCNTPAVPAANPQAVRTCTSSHPFRSTHRWYLLPALSETQRRSTRPATLCAGRGWQPQAGMLPPRADQSPPAAAPIMHD